jgi:hypothetical protein
MTISTRQRLNLQAPQGQKLVLTQLETGSTLTAEGTMTMNLPVLKLISDGSVVNNVAQTILATQTLLASEQTARFDADTALGTRIDDEVTARNTAITNEATARSSADSTLQININNEANARSLADTSLQQSIDAVVQYQQTDHATVTAAIAAETAAREQAISDLSTTVANTSNSIQLSLNTQVSDLNSSIEAQKDRIDGILNLSSTELDSFKEIADAYQNADSNLLNLINNLTTDFIALKTVVDTLVTNLD